MNTALDGKIPPATFGSIPKLVLLGGFPRVELVGLLWNNFVLEAI